MDKMLSLYEQVSYDLNLFRERRIAELKKQPCGMPEREGVKEDAGRKPETKGRLLRDMH